jgi:hypothetical protein
MIIAIVTSSTEQKDIDRANLLGVKHFYQSLLGQMIFPALLKKGWVYKVEFS